MLYHKFTVIVNDLFGNRQFMGFKPHIGCKRNFWL